MVKKIIMAEDSESLRNTLIRYIKDSYDVEIEGVNDGAPLVEKVKSSNYDLIFTDYQMITLDGLEAIRQIREFNKDVPIYMLSGSSKENEALAAGATAYIKKSVDSVKKIKEVLEKHIK